MKACYFLSDKLEKTREKINENLEDYKKGKLKFVKISDLINANKIEIEDFKFDMSTTNPNKTDYENIKRFYLALKNLKDSQATDERLWAGLCHHPLFQNYLKYRWNCQTIKEVERRYFFGPDRPMTTNALARLWWYGRMTYDESAKDPFELTRYICENLTEKGLRLLIFKFANNRRICRVYLRALMNFEKKQKLNDGQQYKIKQKVNLLGGRILLDSLTDEELTKKINEYLNNIIKKKSNKKLQKEKITKNKSLTNKKNPTKKVQKKKITKKKAPTKKETKKQNKTDTTSKINKLFSNTIKKNPKVNKKCPKCSTVAKNELELEKLFGKRKVGKKEIPQSRCRKCRKKNNKTLQ